MSEKQRTIQKEATLSGTGLHTGKQVNITFKPAEINTGYRFKRVDLEGQPIVHAIADNVVDTSRSTVLEENGARVGTVEHILAACYAMGVDNVLIEIDAPETPILDGSAQQAVAAIESAGVIEQEADREYFVIKNNVNFSDEQTQTEIITFPDEQFSINVMIDYNSEILGHQYASLNSLDEFKEEIASARTFVFLKEVEYLFDNNLIKGGDLDNAIVIMEREMDQEELDRLADKFGKSRIASSSGARGYLNNTDLRFSNEPARHKLLDMLGDLALVGHRIRGKILANRPGHLANTTMAKKMRQIIKQAKHQAPEYDPNLEPVYDINAIKKKLPHRSPFLFVDKIIKHETNEVVGIKNVTHDEHFFTGHFPDSPVFPGVLIVEALAQVGGVLVLSEVPDPENYLTYFLKIDKVKFRKMVIPGDTLIMKMEKVTPLRRGIVTMRGHAYVGKTLVAEGEFTAQIAKTKNN